MNFLRQCEEWVAELEFLDDTLRRAGAVRDSLELEEQIQCYRGTLTAARDNAAVRSIVSARSVLPFRRSIDLLSYPCVETGQHAMIRRANQAASVLFNLPLPLITGQPLLVFIAKEDRRALLPHLARLHRTQGPRSGGWLVRCKPLFHPPVLTFLTGERVEDPDQNFVGIVWRFSRETPHGYMPELG